MLIYVKGLSNKTIPINITDVEYRQPLYQYVARIIKEDLKNKDEWQGTTTTTDLLNGYLASINVLYNNNKYSISVILSRIGVKNNDTIYFTRSPFALTKNYDINMLGAICPINKTSIKVPWVLNCCNVVCEKSLYDSIKKCPLCEEL
mgnify:CR=1 FL=1